MYYELMDIYLKDIWKESTLNKKLGHFVINKEYAFSRLTEVFNNQTTENTHIINTIKYPFEKFDEKLKCPFPAEFLSTSEITNEVIYSLIHVLTNNHPYSEYIFKQIDQAYFNENMNRDRFQKIIIRKFEVHKELGQSLASNTLISPQKLEGHKAVYYEAYNKTYKENNYIMRNYSWFLKFSKNLILSYENHNFLRNID